jgi:hypothetical protein
MLTLLTLIKNEIHDYIVYFFGALTFSVILIGISLSITYNYKPVELPLFSIGLGILVIIIVILGFCVMGAIQMYIDRTRNISAFLLTLPVRRGQILIARIVTGFLAILTFFVPATIAVVFLSRLLIHPIPIYNGMVFEISESVFLMAFTCYCIGLQTGWSSNKIIPILGGLILTFVLVPLIVVKGFGFHSNIILIFLIIASLVRIRHKFISTTL